MLTYTDIVIKNYRIFRIVSKLHINKVIKKLLYFEIISTVKNWHDLDNQLLNGWPQADPDVQERMGLCVSANFRAEASMSKVELYNPNSKHTMLFTNSESQTCHFALEQLAPYFFHFLAAATSSILLKWWWGFVKGSCVPVQHIDTKGEMWKVYLSEELSHSLHGHIQNAEIAKHFLMPLDLCVPPKWTDLLQQNTTAYSVLT